MDIITLPLTKLRQIKLSFLAESNLGQLFLKMNQIHSKRGDLDCKTKLN